MFDKLISSFLTKLAIRESEKTLRSLPDSGNDEEEDAPLSDKKCPHCKKNIPSIDIDDSHFKLKIQDLEKQIQELKENLHLIKLKNIECLVMFSRIFKIIENEKLTDKLKEFNEIIISKIRKFDDSLADKTKEFDAKFVYELKESNIKLLEQLTKALTPSVQIDRFFRNKTWQQKKI